MRVLIIGGTGFIGAYVARRLAEDGHRVSLAWERASQWRDFDVKRCNYASEDEALCSML